MAGSIAHCAGFTNARFPYFRALSVFAPSPLSALHWRLPSASELHNVFATKAPDAANFELPQLDCRCVNEGGDTDRKTHKSERSGMAELHRLASIF